MGPPPYGRSSTQPYQKPLAEIDRNIQEHQQMQDSFQVGLCLVPEFSHLQNTFEVTIKRNSLGLGFSITGGTDAPSPWTNLIRIKKIFPLQPAWETGALKVGDVIIKVSGVPLSSLSLRQALDILRTSPPLTTLQVCRVPDPVSSNQRSSPQNSKGRSSVVRSYSYGPYNINTWETFRADQDGYSRPLGELSPGVRDLSSTGDSMEIEISPATPEKEWSPGREEDEENTMDLLKPVERALAANCRVVGEFTVTLTKVNGSLGFSLQSTDDTVLNHTIKGIVREPAVSDGRLQAGDKLVSANGVDLSTFSHQELIMFLRQCDDSVTLGLYRDASRSQTPLDPDSPTYNTRGSSPCRKHLRYEAKELVRSLQSSRTSLEKAGLGSQPGSYCSGGTLGRRRGRPFSPGGHLVGGRGHNTSSAGQDTGLHLTVSSHLTSSPVPTVESPVTPHNVSAPASLAVTQAFAGLRLEERLRIEEVEGGGGGENDSSYSNYTSSPNIYGSGGIYSPGYYDGDQGYSRPCSDLQICSIPNSPTSGAREPRNISSSLPRGGSQAYFQTKLGAEYPARRRPQNLNLSPDMRNRRQGYIFSPTTLQNSTEF